MPEKKLYTVTDLGGGDGGKGGVVHKLCCVKDAHTVVKVGGAQGSHGVRTSRGQSFNFSQFGCGTFEGVRTHISDRMVMEPISLVCEGEALKHQWGIGNIFDYLTVDRNALCITHFHTAASRLRELARKDKPKGTIGTGAGEAMLDSELFPETAIYAKDIGTPALREKLEAVRRLKQKQLGDLLRDLDSIWPKDTELAFREMEILSSDQTVPAIIAEFEKMRSLVQIVDSEYLAREILSQDGAVVVESSHGILTDRYHGFHPNVSRLRTVPEGTFQMLRDAKYDGQIVKLGVTRGYQIRHGAGPMVTESPELLKLLLPGSNKDENRWQGKVRVGPLDLVALRYSIGVCGGPQAFDALAVTWFDQVEAFGRWDVCDRYKGSDNLDYFSPEGEILIRRGTDEKQTEYQERLGKQLNICLPVTTTYQLPLKHEGQAGLTRLCKEVLEEKLGIPVRMISYGPTENDKVCI